MPLPFLVFKVINTICKCTLQYQLRGPLCLGRDTWLQLEPASLLDSHAHWQWCPRPPAQLQGIIISTVCVGRHSVVCVAF